MSVSTPKDLLKQLQDSLRRNTGLAGQSGEQFLVCEKFKVIYEPVLWTFIKWHAPSLSTQERRDLIDDIWDHVYLSLQRFEYDSAKRFRDWLETIVKRRVIDEIRRTRGRYKKGHKPKVSDASGLGNAIDPKAIDPAEALEQSWRIAKVRAAIDDLRREFSDRDYRLFRRVMIDEVARKAVAAEFGVSLDVVEKQVQRFQKRLTELLVERFSRDGSSSESP